MIDQAFDLIYAREATAGNVAVIEDGNVVYKDLSQVCVDNLKSDGIDCLFTLGGDSTQKSARDFSLRGINVIGVPKTIDNDLAVTDHCPGYASAAKYVATSMMEIKCDATVYDTPIVCVVEVMGRNAGWLTAAASLASYNKGLNNGDYTVLSIE